MPKKQSKNKQKLAIRFDRPKKKKSKAPVAEAIPLSTMLIRNIIAGKSVEGAYLPMPGQPTHKVHMRKRIQAKSGTNGTFSIVVDPARCGSSSITDAIQYSDGTNTNSGTFVMTGDTGAASTGFSQCPYGSSSLDLDGNYEFDDVQARVVACRVKAWYRGQHQTMAGTWSLIKTVGNTSVQGADVNALENLSDKEVDYQRVGLDPVMVTTVAGGHQNNYNFVHDLSKRLKDGSVDQSFSGWDFCIGIIGTGLPNATAVDCEVEIWMEYIGGAAQYSLTPSDSLDGATEAFGLMNMSPVDMAFAAADGYRPGPEQLAIADEVVRPLKSLSVKKQLKKMAKRTVRRKLLPAVRRHFGI